jgi:hypothetical protein
MYSAVLVFMVAVGAMSALILTREWSAGLRGGIVRASMAG